MPAGLERSLVGKTGMTFKIQEKKLGCVVIDVHYLSHFGDPSTIQTNIKAFCCTRETDVTLRVSYVSVTNDYPAHNVLSTCPALESVLAPSRTFSFPDQSPQSRCWGR